MSEDFGGGAICSAVFFYFNGAQFWIRTSDFFLVEETLYR